MSFFGKLKSKLFKSSAKLEEGLDAIVQEDVAPEEEENPSSSVATDAAVQVAPPEQEAMPRASAPQVEIDPLEVDRRPVDPLPQKTGVFGRAPRRLLDDDMLEQLEELLISSDMGVDTAVRLTANLAEGRYGRKLSTAEIKSALAEEIARVMEPVARPLPIYKKTAGDFGGGGERFRENHHHRQTREPVSEGWKICRNRGWRYLSRRCGGTVASLGGTGRGARDDRRRRIRSRQPGL